MTKSNFWKFDDVISDNQIKQIIDIGYGIGWKQSTIGGVSSEQDVDTSVILGDRIFFNDQQWLYNLIFPLMHIANENAGWKFDITRAEDFHITRWDIGGHYDYHIDGLGFHEYKTDNNLNGMTRKISIVIWLNDDFEGGEFEFHPTYGSDNLHIPKKGQAMLYPSWIMHRVRPVTKGKRYSVLTCFVGNPIK